MSPKINIPHERINELWRQFLFFFCQLLIRENEHLLINSWFIFLWVLMGFNSIIFDILLEVCSCQAVNVLNLSIE